MKVSGILALDTVVSELSKLPGIGRKTAQRLAIFLLKADKQFISTLAQALTQLKTDIRQCKRCFNIAEGELCSICSNPQRDSTIICVVEDIVDILAIEESHEFDGLFHVLGGVISPLAGVLPSDLKIDELMARIHNDGIKEVLLALNPSTEGEATMIYISKLMKNENVRLTRIASGIPIGSHLEFIDTATIGRAILTRREL